MEAPDSDTAEPAGQAIRCTPAGAGTWSLRVNDAVGVIAVDGLQIIVEPKIPTSHLIFLLEASGQVPRLSASAASLNPGQSFWELVAQWYVAALEQLLRIDLIRDYRERRDVLSVVRGRVDAPRTVGAFLRGRIEVSCEFEEFDQDNALNRVLLAAARVVTGSPLLSPELRRRALRSVQRMADIGAIRPSDLSAVLERRTAHYEEPVALATSVLAGHARTLQPGGEVARTFLFRTPELVEEGLRATLATLLGADWTVEKRGLKLGDTGLTLTPDLLFNGGLATGDVKYKLTSSDWVQSDLYQAVAFATAFRSTAASVISFREPAAGNPRTVPVGPVLVTSLTWNADVELPPQAAASELAESAESWLRNAESALSVRSR